MLGYDNPMLARTLLVSVVETAFAHVLTAAMTASWLLVVHAPSFSILYRTMCAVKPTQLDCSSSSLPGDCDGGIGCDCIHQHPAAKHDGLDWFLAGTRSRAYGYAEHIVVLTTCSLPLFLSNSRHHTVVGNHIVCRYSGLNRRFSRREQLHRI